MVYSWISIVVRFMVVVPGGLAVGWIFYLLLPESQNPLVDFRNDTWNSHNTWLIRNDISDEFPGLFLRKVTAGNCRALVAVCALIFQKDLLHFDSYIPKQEDIASMNLNMMSFDRITMRMSKRPKMENMK